MSSHRQPGKARFSAVARAAVTGASHEELIGHALTALQQAGGADRFGIWLRKESSNEPGLAPPSFHGAVSSPRSESPPQDWSLLVAEDLSSLGRLSAGKTVERQLSAQSAPAALVPFAKLRFLLWVPIHYSGCLLGVIVAGSSKGRGALPREAMESIAAELSVVLAFQSERETSRYRSMDLKFCRRLFSDLSVQDLEQTLLRVARNCTESLPLGGLAARFAAIARAAQVDESSEEAIKPEFAWKSGQRESLDLLQSAEVTALGVRALESGRAAGIEISPAPLANSTALRVLAVPLIAHSVSQGVMVAGFELDRSSLGMLQRLELRGSCAAAAIGLSDANTPSGRIGPNTGAQTAVHGRSAHREKLAALGELVSGVAHELSNPLTSIVGYAQRLLVRHDDLQHREEIRRIFIEAERASAILRQMLLTARETSRDGSRISLNDVVQRTVELQRLVFAAHKIAIELDLDRNAPPVLGDAGQLQQVLTNLLANARQALEHQESGGVIRVRTAATEAPSGVRLEVSDNGPGIPSHLVPRIFDPFFTTKPAGAGTGLGLSIVTAIVREHRGQVRVYNSPGGGATFTIDLPAADTRREAEIEGSGFSTAELPKRTVRARSSLRARTPAPSRNRVPTVLVVEDEPTVAQLIADVLRDEGFRVDSVLNGRDARRRVAVEEFDLVICDMKMPDFDGAQFYQALVRAKNPLHHRFLFVTGDVLAARTREFLERSRIPYVAKPFRVEELTEKVSQVLGEESGSLEPHEKNAAIKG